MKRFCFFIFLFLFSESQAFEYRKLTQNQRLLVAPEVSHAKRTREGGTEQSGWLYGIHLNYDRLKSQGLYWGFDGYYTMGSLSGKSGSGTHLKSDFTDAEAEGRLGWSFGFGVKKPILITPFINYGYIYNKNDFDNVSVVFEDTAQYYGGGILARVCWSENTTFGVNFSYQSMFEGKSKLAEAIDPEDRGAELMMENKNFYTLEFPISYRFPSRQSIQAWVIPFYRHRHFGGRSNFPQDFIDTKYRFYGVRATLCCCF